MSDDFLNQSDPELTQKHTPGVEPDGYDALTRPSLPVVPLPGPETSQTGPDTMQSGSTIPAPQGSAPPYGSYDYGTQAASAARQRDRRRRVRSRRKGGSWAWVIVAVALFGVTLVVSLSVFLMLRGRSDPNTEDVALVEDSDMVTAASTAVIMVPTTVPNLDLVGSGGGPGDEPVANEEGIMVEAWDGEERFTVLVMGWDRRPGESGNSYRTDTMMVVSLDPGTDSIGVLSIPRDLYVEIPGFAEYQRVNSAVVYGELQRPGYGPTLAMQTVQRNLGIRVHDYIIVDFNTFITFVDSIGGIEIDVPQTINDPLYPNMNYGYDPFYITAGHHHMDGQTALKYSRTRHGSSDFRRAERQQQVILAIRDRILSWGGLPQFIINAPALWGEVQNGVQTGLSFEQLLRLGLYAKDVSFENVHLGVITEEYVSYYTTSSGASVVIPRRSRIGPLMVELFGENYAE